MNLGRQLGIAFLWLGDRSESKFYRGICIQVEQSTTLPVRAIFFLIISRIEYNPWRDVASMK